MHARSIRFPSRTLSHFLPSFPGAVPRGATERRFGTRRGAPNACGVTTGRVGRGRQREERGTDGENVLSGRWSGHDGRTADAFGAGTESPYTGGLRNASIGTPAARSAGAAMEPADPQPFVARCVERGPIAELGVLLLRDAALPGAAAPAADEAVTGEGSAPAERLLLQDGIPADGTDRSRSLTVLSLSGTRILLHVTLAALVLIECSARSFARAASAEGPIAKQTGPGHAIMSRPVGFSGGLVRVYQAIQVPPALVVNVMNPSVMQIL
jgi:hypothetical protein